MDDQATAADLLDSEVNLLHQRLLTAAREEDRLAVIRDLGLMLLAKDYFAAKLKAHRVEPEPVLSPKLKVVTGSGGLTLDDVKSAAIEAQKRTGANAVQKIVMEHGGKKSEPKGGEGPSLIALPPEQFKACVAALRALPTTR